MKDKFLIIDGSSILFRSFYAIPDMMTKSGEHTNAVLGFINIMLKAIDMTQATHIAVCFDLDGKAKRVEKYEEYKANRVKAPDELSEQFFHIKDVLDGFDIKYFELEGYEADDLAGTLSKAASRENAEIYLLTGDRDYLQLVDKNTKVLYTITGVSELKIYDEALIMEEYGIEPKQIIDLKALMGDKSDNIPGIPGIGEKTALKLLKEFSNVEQLYDNLDKLKKNKTNQKIIDNREMAFLSKDLATININAPIELKKEEVKYDGYDDEKLYRSLSKYQLNSIIKRLNLNKNNNAKNGEIEIIENLPIFDFYESIDIKNENNLYFKLLSDKKAHFNGKIIKYAIKYRGNYYLFDYSADDVEVLKKIFENKEIKKYGYDIKEDILHLMNIGIDIENYVSDIQIAEYLLDPTAADYSIEKLCAKYNIVFEDNFPDEKTKKTSADNWTADEQKSFLITVLKALEPIYNEQAKKISELDMTDLYKTIELPLVKVLADMEYTGVTADKDALVSIGKDFDFEIEKLTEKIYFLAGEEFNINSPKQLAEILFEKLKLPVIKRTKTGYSTNIDVLEKLEDKHEIVSYIIRYRTISKLKNTYVDGMGKYINSENGKVHTNYNQTVAATGRLSSTEPNLQNIPIRTDEGRELRKIFKAGNKNSKLIDADYSQIELRLLADFSNDENMIKAFKNGEDIHRATAAKVFGVKQEEVTSVMRSRAKAVNFGIVYGISDFGLSRDLNIPINEAKEYIDNYMERFSGVSRYMEEIVEFAKQNGYVETKYNRKRFLPELKSKNFNIRNFGERIALNTPIQGTAADIIKIAMIRVYEKLKEGKYKTKLIMQIHDELILEAPIDEVDEVKKILVYEMENAANLSVPLVVDVKVGDSWYDTK